MSSLTFRIPGTLHQSLTGNSRAHWAVIRRHKDDLMDRTRWGLYGVVDPEDPVQCFQRDPWPLTIDYHVAWEKGRRMYTDDDNLAIGFKAARDMIASWIGVDDRHFVTGKVAQSRDPEGTGYIEVTITAAQEAEGAA